MTSVGTFLPFPIDVSNGRSFQKLAFGVGAAGIAERYQLGRLLNGCHWSVHTSCGLIVTLADPLPAV